METKKEVEKILLFFETESNQVMIWMCCSCFCTNESLMRCLFVQLHYFLYNYMTFRTITWLFVQLHDFSYKYIHFRTNIYIFSSVDKDWFCTERGGLLWTKTFCTNSLSVMYKISYWLVRFFFQILYVNSSTYSAHLTVRMGLSVV